MSINLLDLECILIEKENFEVEFNGVDKTMSSDELWDMVHCEKIDYIDLVEGEFTYIRFKNEDSLVILLEEGTI